MNFGKRIDKLRRKLRCIQTELDTLLEMDRPPVNRVEKVRQRHAEASIVNWLRDLPEEQGNYLWINIWSCDCCVRSSGIAWIREVELEEKGKDVSQWGRPDYTWTGKDGKLWGLFWERGNDEYGIRPDGLPDVDYFLKLELPPHREDR